MSRKLYGSILETNAKKRNLSSVVNSLSFKKVLRGAALLVYPVFDFAGIVICGLLAYHTYHALEMGKQMVYPWTTLLGASVLTGILTCIVLWFTGAYQKESSLLNVSELRSVIKGICLAFTLFAVATFTFRAQPSRYMVGIAFGYALIFFVIHRTILYHLHPRVAKWLQFHKRVLIYGAGELGTALYRQMINSPRYNYLPVGFIDDDPLKRNQLLNCSGFNTHECIRVLGDFDDLPGLVDAYKVNFIYVAISGITNTHLEAVFQQARKLGIRVRFLPNLYRAFLHRLKIAQLGPFPIIEEINSVNARYIFLKRFLDLSMTIALIPLLLPTSLLIALLIKLDSKGPVLFTHQRIGKNGTPFTMYKFRSMHLHSAVYAENPHSLTDPRITRFGRFLRKTSLDELPQVLNVLKGDMSLVGPRPEMPFIAAQYNAFQKERLTILPGITGLWQLSGDRSKAIHENMDYDLYYISNMSFFLDLAILLETVLFAFRGI